MGGDQAPLVLFSVITAAAVVIVALVLWHRSQVRAMVSRERLAALERGPADLFGDGFSVRTRSASRLHLKSGVVLIGAGLGLVGSSPVLAHEGSQVTLAWGIFLFVLGLVNVLYDVFVGKHEWERARVLEEALVRAYIRRLEATASGAPQGTSPEAGDAGR